MTTWTPTNLSPRGPVYLAIADALGRDLDGGLLSPGERLPTHRELARRIGVNVVTVTRAYAESARRGLVAGEVGRGTFVSRREPNVAPHLPLRPELGSLIDFHFNQPVLGSDVADTRAIVRRMLDDGIDPLAAEYLPAGTAAHRAAGAAWMSRTGLETDPERVVLTSGGQHAMSVAFSTLTSPGDTVLMEELTYPGMKSLASLLHLRTLPVAIDEHGIIPAALETACRKSNPKALYCMPTLHNPTGIVWPEERRRAVVEVARRYGVMIVEDDTTGFLVERAPLPLAALAPSDVVFVSSTSKSIGAGLRVGYLHLPTGRDGLYDHIVASVAAQSWMTSPMMAEIATRLIEGGEADRIVAWRRREVRARRRASDRRLGSLTSGTHPACSFLWLTLPDPWRSADFTEDVRRVGVALTSAEAFVVGRAHAPHAVRICIGTPAKRADVERGVRIVAERIQCERPVCRTFV